MTDTKIEEIAAEIISFAEGSFHLDRPEAYDSLTETEQQKVDDIVNDEIGSCDVCGWNWSFDNMSYYDKHGYLCCHCESNLEEDDDDE